MLNIEHKQSSLHSSLYDRIPENHILKLINNSVDFGFVNTLLEDSYCKYYGRPAKEPEMMVRLLVLQYLYNCSDIEIIEQTSVNLAYILSFPKKLMQFGRIHCSCKSQIGLIVRNAYFLS